MTSIERLDSKVAATNVQGVKKRIGTGNVDASSTSPGISHKSDRYRILHSSTAGNAERFLCGLLGVHVE